jgi:hypothetical protein
VLRCLCVAHVVPAMYNVVMYYRYTASGVDGRPSSLIASYGTGDVKHVGRRQRFTVYVHVASQATRVTRRSTVSTNIAGWAENGTDTSLLCHRLPKLSCMYIPTYLICKCVLENTHKTRHMRQLNSTVSHPHKTPNKRNPLSNKQQPPP